MATGDYCTVQEAREYIGLPLDSVENNALLTVLITTASRLIDGYCGRRFYTTASDEARYFTADPDSGCDAGTLWLWDDLLSVASLATDEDGDGTYETTWNASDYRLFPENAAVKGRPYTWIETTANGAYGFPTGVRAGVKITGKFGYSSTTPDTVKGAVLLQVSRLYNRKSAPFGVMGSAEMGQMTVIPKIDPDVELMLRGLKRV